MFSAVTSILITHIKEVLLWHRRQLSSCWLLWGLHVWSDPRNVESPPRARAHPFMLKRERLHMRARVCAYAWRL